MGQAHRCRGETGVPGTEEHGSATKAKVGGQFLEVGEARLWWLGRNRGALMKAWGATWEGWGTEPELGEQVWGAKALARPGLGRGAMRVERLRGIAKDMPAD